MNYNAIKKYSDVTWRQIGSSKKSMKSQFANKPNKRLKTKRDLSQNKNYSWAHTTSEIAWLTLLLFGLVQGYLFFNRSSYWTVSHVRLNGNKILTEKQLHRLTGPIKGKNIFELNLSLLAKRLEQHPWVHKVSVERKLPNIIQAHITERTPMARVRLDKTYVVDNFGVLLEEDTSRFFFLPLIQGIDNSRRKPGDRIIHESFAPSLKMMHYLNKLAFFQNDPVHEIKIENLNRVIFTTKEDHTQIRMSLENPKKTFEKFKALLGLDEFGQTAYEYIDLSFQEQVVVKPLLVSGKLFHRS